MDCPAEVKIVKKIMEMPIMVPSTEEVWTPVLEPRMVEKPTMKKPSIVRMQARKW